MTGRVNRQTTISELTTSITEPPDDRGKTQPGNSVRAL